jgi:hypothetical protein
VLSHVIGPISLRSLRSFEGGAPHLAKIKPLFAGNAKERSGKTDRKITKLMTILVRMMIMPLESMLSAKRRGLKW